MGAMSGKLLPFSKENGSGAALSDAALVAACALREPSALDELFRRHGARVYRLLARLPAVDRRDLEDLVQTTFIEVYRTASGYRARAPVTSWILGIALNVMRHHVRGEVRRKALTAAAAAVGPLATVPHPDETASQKELAERLQKGFAELPEDLQLVFTLCDFEGMKGVEAARVLGMPEGTLWRKLHEARQALRDALDEGNRQGGKR
jgi:RNA polymerase sigma-70 factor (ECF subfamily)